MPLKNIAPSPILLGQNHSQKEIKLLYQYKKGIEENNIVSKTDINGIITFANEEFCKISGYNKEELIGKNHNIVRHPDVPKQKFRQLWETILSKNTYKSTVKNRSKDGKTFYVNTTVFPILDENENIVEFVAIRYDVTAEVELSNQLEKKERELADLNASLEKRVEFQTLKLKELNQNLEQKIKIEVEKNREKDRLMFQQARLASLGEMIGNIAHQWRQPLSELNIILFKFYKMSRECLGFSESLYTQGVAVTKKMSQTIDDFRNFFAPTKEKEKFTIKDILNDSFSIIEKTLYSENISIDLDIKNNFEIIGYRGEFSQVVINILNNAKDVLMEKKDDRKIKISVFGKNGKNYIQICDNGGGIKQEIIEKIFDPYFTTKHASNGTGIGLYMCKSIVLNMDANIEAFNDIDGACFKIEFKDLN